MLQGSCSSSSRHGDVDVLLTLQVWRCALIEMKVNRSEWPQQMVRLKSVLLEVCTLTAQQAPLRSVGIDSNAA